MTMPSLSDLFDAYALRARVYPALLTLLPLIVAAYCLVDLSSRERLLPLLVSAGGVYFLASVVRGWGLAAEERLIRIWGGWPSTQALRWASPANSVIRDRRRVQLERVTGQTLPTQAEELADPTASDARYHAAVRQLIVRLRQHPDSFPRVHDELTQYGFRRNLYGSRPVGVGVCLLTAAWGFSVLIVKGVSPPATIALIVSAAELALWLLVVNPKWVRQAGDRYAERLMETLEDPLLRT